MIAQFTVFILVLFSQANYLSHSGSQMLFDLISKLEGVIQKLFFLFHNQPCGYLKELF